MTPEKKYFGLKLSDELLNWLRDEADRQGETQSTVIRNLIREKMGMNAPQGVRAN